MTTKIELAQTLYNMVRCGLIFAEDSLPKLAQETSNKVQNYTLGLDLVATCLSGWQLCSELQKKYQTFYERHKDHFNMCITAGSVALLGAAAFLIKDTNSALTPQVNLNTLIPIEAQALGNLAVSWKRPLANDLIRGLFFVRIVLNLGLAVLQSTPYQSLLNSLLQSASLVKMSLPQWIQITRTYKDPFQTMRCTIVEGGTLEEFQQTVNELQATFYLKITSFEKPDLQSKIKSVYDYSNKVFQNSSWSRYWEIKTSYRSRKEEYSSRLSEKSAGDRLRKVVYRIVSDTILSLFGFSSSAEQSAKVAYSVKLDPNLSQLSVPSFFEAKLFHQDKMWQPFQMINWPNWKQPPQFFTPGHTIMNRAWPEVDIT